MKSTRKSVRVRLSTLLNEAQRCEQSVSHHAKCMATARERLKKLRPELYGATAVARQKGVL